MKINIFNRKETVLFLNHLRFFTLKIKYINLPEHNIVNVIIDILDDIDSIKLPFVIFQNLIVES